jgi:hypothetical protein
LEVEGEEGAIAAIARSQHAIVAGKCSSKKFLKK